MIDVVDRTDLSRPRRILFLTATRADFGKLKSLMLRVERAPDLECRIFVTGMHMMERYGSTSIEVHKCGFSHVFEYLNQMSHTSSDMDMVLAGTVQGLGHYVREYRPDMIVVHGDRVEALAGAIVGALNNILVAHIEGGEISGTVDELIRHAVTKMAHLHFVANEEAVSRLAQMGERRESIFVIGSPDIDIMFSDDLPPLEFVKEYYGIDYDEYAIFMYHPVTTESRVLAGEKVGTVIDALEASGKNVVAIYPNNDTGSDVILERVRALEGNPRFRVFPSLRFEYFLTLLKNAEFMIGNSSAGVREAPVYCIPSINVGSRQANRYEYSSIVTVVEDKDAILNAIAHLPRADGPSDYFGNGNSARLFLDSLRTPAVWDTPCQKQFQDLVELGSDGIRYRACA